MTQGTAPRAFRATLPTKTRIWPEGHGRTRCSGRRGAVTPTSLPGLSRPGAPKAPASPPPRGIGLNPATVPDGNGRRPVRPAALRRRPGLRGHVRGRDRRIAGRAQAQPLDVVRVPADRRAGPNAHRAAVRDRLAPGGPGVSRSPGARTAPAPGRGDRGRA